MSWDLDLTDKVMLFALFLLIGLLLIPPEWLSSWFDERRLEVAPLVVLVFVTVVYARAAKKGAKAAHESIRANVRPYPRVSLAEGQQTFGSEIVLSVQNIGKGAALIPSVKVITKGFDGSWETASLPAETEKVETFRVDIQMEEPPSLPSESFPDKLHVEIECRDLFEEPMTNRQGVDLTRWAFKNLESLSSWIGNILGTLQNNSSKLVEESETVGIHPLEILTIFGARSIIETVDTYNESIVSMAEWQGKAEEAVGQIILEHAKTQGIDPVDFHPMKKPLAHGIRIDESWVEKELTSYLEKFKKIMGNTLDNSLVELTTLAHSDATVKEFWAKRQSLKEFTNKLIEEWKTELRSVNERKEDIKRDAPWRGSE